MAAVVGAGPAGLAAARRIQERGWKTAVLEEHPTVGDPVACTGLISASGVHDLGIRKEVEEVLMNKVRGAKIYSHNHELIEVKRSETAAFVVDRGEFDKVLCRGAVEAGVDLKLNTRMIDVRNETVFVEHKGRGELLKSKVVVGADGVNSRTRKIMGINTTAENFVHAYQVDAKGNFDPKYVQIFFGDYAKDFFAWIVPENEERARVGLASTSGNIRKDFNVFVSEKHVNGEFCDMCSSLIPVGEPLKGIVKENMMLVGDAAFQTKATSIDYEEPIVILDEEGYIRNEKIGEIAAAELTNPRNETICSKDNEIAYPERDIMAFSPSQKAENNGFRRVKTVLRHQIDEELYEIILEKGYRVKATASHSVMVATKDGFAAKQTGQLEAGKDIIALNAKIPCGKTIEEMSLVKEFVRYCPEMAQNLNILGARERLYKNYKEVDAGKASQHWYNNSIPLKKFLDNGIMPAGFRISVPKSKLSYEDRMPFTAELCRLLGYFAAEGSYKSNNLTLTFGIKDIERGYVQDATECIRKALGIEPEKSIVKKHPHTKEPSAVSITFGGTIARNFFLKVLKCGHKAVGKQVPWVIFNARDELKKEFLKGYLRGDGSIRIREPEDKRHSSIEISAKTVSRKMASDIVLLSLQLGMFPSIEEFEARDDFLILGKKAKCKEGHKITYSRAEDMLLLKDVFHSMENKIAEFISARKGRSTNNVPKELLEGTGRKFSKELVDEFGPSIYSQYSNLSSARLQTVLQNAAGSHQFVKNVVSQGIILLKLREIRKVEPTESYVYDVEIPETQMFCGGIGPILLHNTGGGIVLGMEAGRIAGDSIHDHFKGNTPLRNYERNCSSLNRELRLHWKIRQYMNSKSEEDIDRLFRGMNRAKFGEFLSEHGDMDRPSKFIGKVMTKPSLWRLFPEALRFLGT